MRARIQKFFWPPTSVSIMSAGRSKLSAPLRVKAAVESRKLYWPWTPETPMVVVRPNSPHLRPFQYSHITKRSAPLSALDPTHRDTAPPSTRTRPSGGEHNSLGPGESADANVGSSPQG